MVKLPLTDREIPIIADAYVDLEFGTGCVKVTPAHDFNDYAVGQRHKLPIISILTLDAKINDNAPEKYRGMDRFDARKAVVADLEALACWSRPTNAQAQGAARRPHRRRHRADAHRPVVRRHEQTGADGTSIVGKALECVASGEIKFVPGKLGQHLQPVAQQHPGLVHLAASCGGATRFPAWYDEGQRLRRPQRRRSPAQAAARLKGITGALTRDPDVLDTWYSSALWPFSTLDWTPEWPKSRTRARPLPALDGAGHRLRHHLLLGRAHGHDDQAHHRQDPVQARLCAWPDPRRGRPEDEQVQGQRARPDRPDRRHRHRGPGQKTHHRPDEPEQAEQIESARARNSPEGIPAFGTDALRFTFLSLASPGRDIKFDLHRCEGYRNFCNKLWNATRFVLMNTEGTTAASTRTPDICPDGLHFSFADRWIVSRCTAAHRGRNRAAFRRLPLRPAGARHLRIRLGRVLRLVSRTRQGADPDRRRRNSRATRRTLVRVLETVLRLAHPLIPFITEELARPSPRSRASKTHDSIMLAAYPKARPERIMPASEPKVQELKGPRLRLPQPARREMNISPAQSCR